MKNIAKKLFILIATVIMMCIISVVASAESYGNLTYSISGGEVTITGCSTTVTEVVIPETIDGYPVTNIGYNAFRDCTNLTNITIPDSVTSIGNSAFENCTSLESITIPEGVTYIDDYAFYNCTSLTSITIPDSVTSIGDLAFYYCTSLTYIVVDENNANYSSDEYGALFNKKKTELKQYPIGNTRIEYIIPDSVTSIGNYAFSGCTSLTSITIPDSVTSIGQDAFFYCTSLTSITIPDSVTSIGESAFNGCTNLESITIPDSVTSIDYAAFSQCYSLKKVYATSIESWLKINFNHSSSTPLYNGAELYFNNELVTDIVIPDSVTSIGNYAFKNCTSLKSITIPDSVTGIGYEAFGDCLNLENVTIGNSVAGIDKFAFSGCSNLTSITIPDSLRMIQMSAFESCSSLKATFYKGTQEQWNNIYIESYNSALTSAVYYNVDEDYLLESNVLFNKNGTMLVKYGAADRFYVVSDGVKSIEQKAFYNDYLHTVILPQGLKNIGSYAFYCADNLTSIYIPASVSTIDTYAFDGTNLTDVYFGGTQEQWNAITIGYDDYYLEYANIHFNSELVIEDGVIYNPDKTVLICYDKDDKVFTVPDTVNTVGERAFKNCKNLQQIILPSGLEEIKSEAFYNCTSLSEIYIPDSVTTIEDSAFYGCTALQSVEFGDGLTTIGNSAFYGCTAIEKLTLPENLVSIGDSAFYGCTNLNDIYFPDSLESIGSEAFENCSLLTYISLPDGLASLGSAVFRNCYALEQICLPESGLASIPANAFNGCSKLSDIYIPGNITSFGDSAFLGCNLLTDIYYGGTEEQWNNISIPSSNSVIWAANIHFEHEHAFGEWTVLIPSQNNSDRVEKTLCLVCGYEKRVSIDGNHVHNYTKVAEIPATCTTAGHASYVCDCELDYTKVLAATGHTFTNTTVDKQHLVSIATCCSKAEYYYKCENCDIFSDIDTFEYGEIDSSNHTGGTEVRNAVTEDCGNDGYTGDTYCLGCNTKISTGTVINATGNHNHTSEITTAATCETTGVKTYTCTVCDDTYTETIEIDTTNHTGGTEILGAYAEDCGNNGYTGDTYCLGCNAKITNGSVIPATGKHNHSSSITLPATCKTTGVRTYICTVCEDTYTETIAIDTTNHSGGTENRGAITEDCGNNGYTGDTYCLGCNKKIANGSAIPATGRHNYTSSVTTPATCKTTGVRTYTCTVCGDSYEEDIPVNANNHAGGTEVRNKKEATCTSDGYSGDVYCTGCNEIVSAGKIINMLGHAEIVLTGKSATCTETGLTEGKKCSVCGEILVAQKELPVTGHTVGEWEVVVPAQVGIEGKEQQKCTVCGTVVNEREIPALEPQYILGDANGDGKITAADARIALRISAKLDKIEDFNLPLAALDVTGDEKLTAADARKILRISAKLE